MPSVAPKKWRVGRDEPEQPVGIALDEEAERRRVVLVGAGHRLEGDRVELAGLDDRIDIGQQAETAVRSGEADRVGRREARCRCCFGSIGAKKSAKIAMTSSRQTRTSPIMPVTERRKRRQTRAQIAFVAVREAG